MSVRDGLYNMIMPSVKYIDHGSARETSLWINFEPKTLPPPQHLSTVVPQSRMGSRKALEVISVYCRRELESNIIEYVAQRDYEDKDYRGYLWVDLERMRAPLPVIGGAYFRRREVEGISTWNLEWVWFHPYVRRHGYLTHAWPFFRSRFGEFSVGPVMSQAMESFLAQADTTSPPKAPTEPIPGSYVMRGLPRSLGGYGNEERQ
jgi:hypothetical protein